MPQYQDANKSSERDLYEQKQFLQGFKFVVKYIGTTEVPRPISRLEIVSAMRRIRYDFKTRSVKKRCVEMSISLAGVHVLLQAKSKTKKSASETCQSSPNPILKNPIHRIFYVSHDSKDTKIFSYIAKEEDSNVFRCSVFKALKKCQAGEIVKTIGQAFEVSHLAHQMRRSEAPSGDSRNQSDADSLLSMPMCPAHEETEAQNSQMCHASEATMWSPLQDQDAHKLDECDLDRHEEMSESPTSEGHHRIVMKQKLKIRCQEITFLKSQNKLLQRQLEVEMQARKQAEASTQLLISQNQELLCQVDVLLKKLSKYEKTLLLKSKNFDLTASCPVHSCLFMEDSRNVEIKNSPDSGLNETSVEGSQNEEFSGPGIDNEGATSSPEKVSRKPDVLGGSLGCTSQGHEPCSSGQQKHKSRMSQLFSGRTKHQQLNLNLIKHRTGSCSAAYRRPESICSDNKSSTQDKDQLIVESPTRTNSTSTSTSTNNTSTSTNNNSNNKLHLKATNQSKSSTKFKLDKMIAIRRSLGDSTTELELSFGD